MAPHLLQLLVVVLFSRGNAATPQSQIETLYALYNQTNGENWKWKNEALNGPIWSFNSLNQQDPCNTNNVPWQGITCSLSPNRCKTSTCYIEKIDLEFYRLVGYLPMDIYALTSLTRLVLQRNQLQGSIPSMVGLLTNMKIMQMSTNSFTGSIPSSIGSLFQLQYFSIDNNEITGSIPSSIGLLSQLESFYVSYNHITGSLPSSIGFLPKLLDFFVPYNLITGTIPSSYGSLSQLLDFSISSNVITGTLPSSLGSMSQLQTFSITSIAVTGSLPLSLGSLSQLQSLYINFNAITGFIPSTFGSLSQLQDLVLSDNRITGPIPSSLGNLTQLQIFDIHNNQITGSIPPILGSLFRLQYFYISGNDITGSIPSTLGSFFQLLYFSIADNHLTGSLPPTLGSFFRLQHFYISNNHITGSLPSSFGSFSQLQVFYCDSNQMTGSIPSSFGSLSQLIYFYISDNQITGSVPPSLGLLSQLQYFHIQNNYITGSLLLLPNNMTQLRQFHAQKNHLSSTISLQLCSFPELEQLFLQQNQFVGSLDMLVSCLIQSSSPLRLENLDVSGNQLSGSIPDPLFFSSLRSIALSVNCFEGELPRSVCTAGNIRTLSLDGLRSSRDCKTQSIVPFTKISIGSMMEGSIPDCIWNLLNLTTLHLSGNGFKGKIGERTLPISRLVDVSLSHNYLSGEIPNWLLSQPNMENLDLSHNKFTGDLDAIRKSWINQNIVRVNTTKALKLSVNRLSGRLPSMMKIYSTLDILSGNLFSCENLPKNDENYEYYVCGSSEYTQSMMLIGGLIGLFILLFLLYLLSVAVFMTISLTQKDETSTSSLTYVFARRIGMWMSKLFEFYFKIINRLRQYFTLCLDKNLLQIKNKEIDNIYFLINNICRSLVEVDKLFLMTTTVMIMSSIPLYMMKNANNQSYVTHSHQYQWYFTIAYLSGILPGLLVLIICFISLWTFYLSLMYLKRRFTLHPSNKNNHEIKKNHDIEDQEFSSSLAVQDNSSAMTNQTNPTTSMNTHPSSSRMSLKFTTRGWIFLCLISFLNIGVVGTVNGLYVWSTLKNLSSLERLSIRLGVSLFGMLWKVIMRSILSTEVKTSLSGIWLLSLFGVINGVIIPCLATTFTSPSCYQASRYDLSYFLLLYHRD